MDTTRIVVDLDTLTHVIDAARLARPSRRLESAYEWLAPLASVQIDAAGCLIVASATWSGTRYHVDVNGCDCPAHGPCWHTEAHNLVMQCRAAAPAVPAPVAPLPRLIGPRVRYGAHHVSYTAAQSSGLDELFA